MLNHNTIYIIGAGAIGKALAVFLKLEGKNVILIRGSIDDKSNYFEKIKVELTNNNTEVEAKVRVSTISNFSTLNGIVVLTNKSHGNRHLAQALKNKINNSPIVILQNGLDVEQPFIDHSFTEIYRCVLFVTSQSISENKVKFKPISASLIGMIQGDLEPLKKIVELLGSKYFPFEVEENIQPMIWTKAIVNCVFNSICPLLETDNGIFHRNTHAISIAQRIINECLYIAKENGILLNSKDVIDKLILISKFSEGQLISTYQDILSKRKTEIESLNFAFVNRANELNKNNRVVETKLLGELLLLKSELNQ